MGTVQHPAGHDGAEPSAADDTGPNSDLRPRPPWDRPEQRAALPELYDALTLLPNEVLLIDRLSMALTRTHRTGEPIAVVRCAVDGFESLRSLLGPDGTDQVLATVAKRLQRSVRTCDTVARGYGDEFILLLERLLHAEDIHVVIGRVHEAMATPIVVDQREHDVSVRMGAVITNDPMLEIEELFAEATRLLVDGEHDGTTGSFSDWTLRIFGDAAAALDRNKH